MTVRSGSEGPRAREGFGGLGEGVSAVRSRAGKDKTVTSGEFVGVGPATGRRTKESELIRDRAIALPANAMPSHLFFLSLV